MFSSQNSQVSNDAVFVEDVFSTYLYTGNGSTQTITNGIDLSTKGGLVWIKDRVAANRGPLVDTARGATKALIPSSTAAQQDETTGLTGFTSSGFTLGTNGSYYNGSGVNYASWTFRKQPKFFDVVTYTGNNATSRQIAHSLGSTPACIIVKCTNAATNWVVYHKDLSTDSGTVDSNNLVLNSTGAQSGGGCFGDDAYQTSTYFTLGRLGSGFNDTFNKTGNTYVAYLFAHDAGGFGLTGTDNVISCGSFTTDGSGVATVNLGYEPQWILVRASGAVDAWRIFDTMRGWSLETSDNQLNPNLSDAESVETVGEPTATGFRFVRGANKAHIYIAIRRGPMKVPTSGTSVLGLNARSGTSANATVTGGAGVTDLAIIRNRTGGATNWIWTPRLAGTGYLASNATTAETAAGTTILQANPWDVMDGVKVGTTSPATNVSTGTFINYLFDRAPSFMDVVCYTGTGSARTVAHNLGVVPELIIVKRRSSASNWSVYNSSITATKYLQLDFTGAASTNSTYWNNTTPTTTDFTVGTSSDVNGSASTYVAYLFATCAGVSKVGSYTGTGTTKQVDCGFTGGARFVLIKRTDSTGDWYVWDSARGIVAGNDPYLLLNSIAAEVTSTDYIDTYSAGFEISSTAPAAINASGGTFIFLAIA